MDCNRIDEDKAKEAIERTNETGNEHGFIQCADGSTSDMIQGGSDSMQISDETIEACNGDAGVFHTHPNGVDDLSDEDRKILQKHENLSLVCAGVQSGYAKKMYCERSQPSCTKKLRQPEAEDEKVLSEELDLSEGVVFMFPNSEGCRCSAWAKQFDEMREDGEKVVGVTTDRPENIQTFAEKLELDYTIVSDPEGAIPETFGFDLESGKAPRAVVVRRGGETVETYEGPYSFNVARESLETYRAALEQPEAECPTFAQPEGYAINKPDWDGLSQSEWSSPDLEDFEDLPTNEWDELTRAKQMYVANHFILWGTGRPRNAVPPEDYEDLKIPVVNTNDNLNVRALRNAKARVGQVEGLGKDSERDTKMLINELASENFPETDFSPVRMEEPPEILDHFEHPSVAVITGKRGSGKSSLAFRMAEAMHRHEGVLPVTVGMPDHVREAIPGDWVHVEQIDDAPSDSVLVVDEAYTQFHATEWQDKNAIEMNKLVNLSRHCGRTILFVSQETRQLNKGGISQTDALLMKKPAPLQIEFERRGVKKLMESARDSYDKLPNDIAHQEYTYVYTDDDVGLIQTDEADFYDDDLSKSYSGVCGKAASSEEMEQPERGCPFDRD